MKKTLYKPPLLDYLTRMTDTQQPITNGPIRFIYAGVPVTGTLTGRQSNQGEIIYFIDPWGESHHIGRNQIKEIK